MASLVAAGLGACRAGDRARPDAPLPAVRVELESLDGTLLAPLDASDAGARAVVIVFVSSTCPVANASAPALAALALESEPRGVAFYEVYVDPALEPDEARLHFAAHDLPGVGLLDPHQRLASALDARATPEAFVFDATGEPLYRGRIDDLFWRPGRRRRAPTTRELGDAIEAALASHRPAVTRTEVVGCRLPIPTVPAQTSPAR